MFDIAPKEETPSRTPWWLTLLRLLLAALVNANDEIPLIGVLRGPLFGLSDEELYRMGRTGWRRVFEDRFAGVRQLAGFVAPDQLIARARKERAGQK